MSLASRLCASTLVLAFFVTSAAADALTDRVLDQHILPTYQKLADTTAALDSVAQADCDLESQDLRTAYGIAFDAWVSASHLRFGPSEVDNRAFAIAFWPDTRTRTPKALRGMLQSGDQSVEDAERFTTASIAVRGLYALEFLLYDPAYHALGTPEYRCALVQAISHDVARNAAAILHDWQTDYADQMRTPHGRYRSDTEVHQELFKALNTGLEMLADMRLGRPLGSFDRPRPRLAEARRSGRSLRHVRLQLEALHQLALLLTQEDAPLTEQIDVLVKRADTHAKLLEDDPVFAGVAEAQNRFRIESLQQNINDFKELSAAKIGPKLGVEAGFNALDGD